MRRLKKTNPIKAWAWFASSMSRSRAKKKGLAHSLGYRDYMQIAQAGICTYCKRTVEFNAKGSDKSATVDRLIPALGYTIENAILACVKCNWRKSDSSLSELKEMVRNLETVLEERKLLRQAVEG